MNWTDASSAPQIFAFDVISCFHSNTSWPRNSQGNHLKSVTFDVLIALFDRLREQFRVRALCILRGKVVDSDGQEVGRRRWSNIEDVQDSAFDCQFRSFDQVEIFVIIGSDINWPKPAVISEESGQGDLASLEPCCFGNVISTASMSSEDFKRFFFPICLKRIMRIFPLCRQYWY